MKTHKGRREKDSEKHTVCPRGIVLVLSSSSWLNGITSVTFGERVFTCSLEGCCAGVLRRDQTEANDPDGNETEFALCRSPQTSQTRPRPLSFFCFLSLEFSLICANLSPLSLVLHLSLWTRLLPCSGRLPLNRLHGMPSYLQMPSLSMHCFCCSSVLPWQCSSEIWNQNWPWFKHC